MPTNLITDVLRIGARAWRYVYAGTSPFDIYDADTAELVSESVSETEYIYEHIFEESVGLSSSEHEDEPHAIEVIDDNETETPVSVQYPAYVWIQWRGNVYAYYYSIQEYIDGGWVDKTSVREGRRGYYKVKLLNVAEGAHTYRVLAIDHEGGASVAATVDLYHVRVPAPPSVAYVYDTPNLTVSAA